MELTFSTFTPAKTPSKWSPRNTVLFLFVAGLAAWVVVAGFVVGAQTLAGLF